MQKTLLASMLWSIATAHAAADHIFVPRPSQDPLIAILKDQGCPVWLPNSRKKGYELITSLHRPCQKPSLLVQQLHDAYSSFPDRPLAQSFLQWLSKVTAQRSIDPTRARITLAQCTLAFAERISHEEDDYDHTPYLPTTSFATPGIIDFLPQDTNSKRGEQRKHIMTNLMHALRNPTEKSDPIIHAFMTDIGCLGSSAPGADILDHAAVYFRHMDYVLPMLPTTPIAMSYYYETLVTFVQEDSKDDLKHLVVTDPALSQIACLATSLNETPYASQLAIKAALDKAIIHRYGLFTGISPDA